MSDLDELYDELSDLHASKKDAPSRSPREERIIAGFEDIERFFEQYGRLPQHGEEKDIFERLYAVRLDKIRSSEECINVLARLDKYGILQGERVLKSDLSDNLDDDEILAELGALNAADNDITKLKHVKARTEIKAAEEIASREPCKNFGLFKPIFQSVQEELKSGIRESRIFKEDASIRQGELFILGGQFAYVAEVGEEFKAPNGDMDARLRVIYDNGTESNLLRRSLQRALYDKEKTGRRITDPVAGPLFSSQRTEEDIESGTIYVLRSKSEHPLIRDNRDVVHKIGVTGGSAEKRIASAKDDPTFLLSEVEVVATYKLANINRSKIESLIHKFLSPARLNIEITDRFGHLVTAREWFLVPLFIIDEMVTQIIEGTISNFYYDPQAAKILPIKLNHQNGS